MANGLRCVSKKTALLQTEESTCVLELVNVPSYYVGCSLFGLYSFVFLVTNCMFIFFLFTLGITHLKSPLKEWVGNNPS